MASTKKSIQKSPSTPAPIAPAPATPAPSAALADSVHEALELAELAHRIQTTLNHAAASTDPGDVRRLCMTAEADLLRASIRLVNVRAMAASAGNAAHVQELQAMAEQVKS